MNFDLTDAQRQIRDLCREFAEQEIRPRAAEIDRLDEFPRDLYKRMAELDLLGMTVPAEYGGAGGGVVNAVTASPSSIAIASPPDAIQRAPVASRVHLPSGSGSKPRSSNHSSPRARRSQ